MAKSTDTLGASQPLWIYNPGLDLIVGCGAWSLPLLLLTYFATNSSTLAWSVAFYGLALFFNYPHYMATIYRAYHRVEDFQKYRIFTVHITALVLLTLVVSHFWLRALPLIFTLYLTWSPWHYSGQNYGLFMMFARRAGAKPSTAERRALYAAFLLSYFILFLSFHTGSSSDLMFVSLGIPGRFSAIAVLPLALGFVVLSAYGLSGLAEQVGWRPLLPSLTLFSTQFVWFLLPTALSMGERLQIPQSRYSTGVLAVMHSAQYLWITSYYARGETSAENTGRWRPLAYFGILMAGGIALFVPGPWLASRVFHYDFTASFLIFTALVNIHHFILDGAIWKLRDGRIAALLLNSRERVTSAKAEAGGQFAAGMRWMIGSSSGARLLRVSAALLLLAWGTVDQVRYYLALRRDNLADLQQAAALNAYDSSLQTRLGHKELEVGRTQEAVAAWQQAMRANPADPAPRNLLLKQLTEQRRFDEAYQLTIQSLRYAPKDANLRVNHGILAEQLGHSQEALDSWNRALRLDPSQWRAHLYMADELDREGKAEAAIPHYVIFLDKAAQLPDPPPAAELVATVLRLAQCQVQANHPDQAEKSYALAQRVASQSSEKKLESFASVSEAELEVLRGKTSEALRLYQHALRLDSTLGDKRSEAADWYNYGLFLRDSRFPTRLVYASLLNSESLMKAFKDSPEFPPIVQAREEAEKKLGGEAAQLRRNPKPALEEALAARVR
jgi:tetratricopeptide (TPR) repeat protein